MLLNWMGSLGNEKIWLVEKRGHPTCFLLCYEGALSTCITGEPKLLSGKALSAGLPFLYTLGVSLKLFSMHRSSWHLKGFPGGSVVKNLPANAEDSRYVGLIPDSGRSPGGENGRPLQYSCLENPMDRGAWRAIVHRVTQSRTWLSTHSIWNVHVIHQSDWGSSEPQINLV